jgi:hypothetical protein
MASSRTARHKVSRACDFFFGGCGGAPPGGQTAKTADLESSGTKMHVRCVSVNNSVYYLMGIPITGSYADVVTGGDALTSGWTWK